jgi:hypothetical protein
MPAVFVNQPLARISLSQPTLTLTQRLLIHEKSRQDVLLTADALFSTAIRDYLRLGGRMTVSIT